MFLTSINEVINEPIASLLMNAAKTGFGVLILGMVIVFAVLAIIFAALMIMRKALNKKPAPKATAQEKPAAVEKPAVAEETAEAPAEDEGAIIAAIIAAISAHTGKSASDFRVVSFKRRH